MQAMRVYRLGDLSTSRLYIDGKRVSRSTWETAHFWRYCDTFASRMHTRRDGSTVVREYHSIRIRH
jgi:hypothetical protein